MFSLLWEIITLPFALLWLAILGGIVGAIARAILPGTDDLGVGHTVLLGAAGSLIAGIVGALIGGTVDNTVLFIPRGGFFSSILGALVALLIYRAYRNTAP
jgi:uncharacterized membrane protein YeaQ/YmgE (transglycosylase-associated protein family)